MGYYIIFLCSGRWGEGRRSNLGAFPGTISYPISYIMPTIFDLWCHVYHSQSFLPDLAPCRWLGQTTLWVRCYTYTWAIYTIYIIYAYTHIHVSWTISYPTVPHISCKTTPDISLVTASLGGGGGNLVLGVTLSPSPSYNLGTPNLWQNKTLFFDPLLRTHNLESTRQS